MTRPIATTGPALDAIKPDWLYPLPVLRRLTGMGDSALRTARRSGLTVHYRAGRAWVLGSDLIAWVTSPEADAEEPGSMSDAVVAAQICEK